MGSYSQGELDGLIASRKTVVRPPRKDMTRKRGHLRNDMELIAENGTHVFRVFMRINERLPENFSIGLLYVPKDDREGVQLLRCNGPHGDVIGTGSTQMHHACHHIHRAREENLVAGLSAERGGAPTDEFSDYREALRIFLAEVNVLDYERHFPGLQLGLFDC